jgi:hypothetical protein
MKKLFFILLALFVIGAGSNLSKEKPVQPVKTQEEQEKYAKETMVVTLIANSIKEKANHPESLKFRKFGLSEDMNTACVQFEGKNKFNGVSVHQAVFVKNKVFQDNASWNAYCAGKSMNDKTFISNYVIG